MKRVLTGESKKFMDHTLLTCRQAKISDIPALHIIRHSVKENVLSNPDLVTEKDYHEFLTFRGMGWVCEEENKILGFAIVDLINHNVWALFIRPEYENRGIGKKLHDLMLDWYFKNSSEPIWLSTDPGTRAEQFYRKRGWKEAGLHGKEIKFELSFQDWVNSVQ